jgi:hypothetical protein
MAGQRREPRTIYRAVGALVALFGLVAMFYTTVAGRSLAELPGVVGNFFSYFTVLTNILVLAAFGAVWLSPESRAGRFFGRPQVRTAIAIYIAVVGAVYFLILRHTWQPEGLRWLADAILHYATPLLFVLDWLLFVPKGRLRWANLRSWLLYPLGYAAYSLARGALTGWYPYPFIDVNALGYGRTLQNMVFFVAVFVLIGALVIAVDRARAPGPNAEGRGYAG